LLLILCATLLALTPWATAQRSARATATRPATPHLNAPIARLASGRAVYASRLHRANPYTSLPFSFFGDSFNPDDIYSTGYPVASQPPVILLQAVRALSGLPDSVAQPESDRSSPSQPLVIELQNGRYVRVKSTPANGEALLLTRAPDRARSEEAQPKSTHSSATLAVAAASPPHELPPALLIFRDGHSEEVRDYTIADGVLYARGDYYTDGYWNKKIELSTLNIAQTLEANGKRNLRFVLPASPNEVITRP
jgi:hypothetical protein